MESLREMYFFAEHIYFTVKGIFRAPIRLPLRVKSKTMELSESIFPNGLIFLKFLIPNFGGKSIEGNHIHKISKFSHIFNHILPQQITVIPHFFIEKKTVFMENGLQST